MSDELVTINEPQGGVSIETISETHTRWYVDAQERGMPSPKMFRDLSIAGSKLVALSTFLPEAYEDEAVRIYQDIVRLQRMLARERLDDEQAVRDLCLGALDELPEVVDVHHEQRRIDEDHCPNCGRPWSSDDE